MSAPTTLEPPRSLRSPVPPHGATRPHEICVWSQRDYDLLQTLTHRVSMLSLNQIVDIWWSGHRAIRNARHRLGRLADAGLVERYQINVHPQRAVTAPLLRWEPGYPEPDFDQVAGAIRNRWSEPSVPHWVFTAGRQTANLFGVPYLGLPSLPHRDHDLLLGSVYVRHRLAHLLNEASWLSAQLNQQILGGGRAPDALLVDADGGVLRAIESAGRNRSHQLRAFHDGCVAQDLPYELW